MHSCPFCGSRLQAGIDSCAKCRLSITTFRQTAAIARPASRGLQKSDRLSQDRVLLALLCVGMVLLRLYVDESLCKIAVSLITLGLLAFAKKKGGTLAVLVSTAGILGADFFFVAPVFQLGVQDWKGVVEIGLLGSVGTGLSIFAAHLLKASSERTPAC
jgi:K+-sensing histidine kinase KdpD